MNTVMKYEVPYDAGISWLAEESLATEQKIFPRR
jgi:hypothetical protein